MATSHAGAEINARRNLAIRSARKELRRNKVDRPEQAGGERDDEICRVSPTLADPRVGGQVRSDVDERGRTVQHERYEPEPPRQRAQTIRMFLNCHGSSRSRSSGNRRSRSASGVQSPQTPMSSPRYGRAISRMRAKSSSSG